MKYLFIINLICVVINAIDGFQLGLIISSMTVVFTGISILTHKETR